MAGATNDRNPSPAPRLVQAVPALVRHRRPSHPTGRTAASTKAAASTNPQRGAPSLQAPTFGDGSEPHTWKRCSTRAKEGTTVPDLRPVVLWRGELDEARTLQCLPGFSRRQPERLSGGHALDLWSLWGGKLHATPLIVKGFGCGTVCLAGTLLLSREAARPQGRKRELLPRVPQE